MMEDKQSKFQQWKTAMKNTPPERLLKINMQGYVMQSIGLVVVCVMILLVRTEWWWLILAFGFALFNNYSGFVSNYQQYTQILEYKKLANIPEQEDKSPHRNKVRLIKEKLGKKVGWITAFSSVVISYILVPSWKWYFKTPIMLLVICISYYLIYFKLFYWIARSRK